MSQPELSGLHLAEDLEAGALQARPHSAAHPDQAHGDAEAAHLLETSKLRNMAPGVRPNAASLGHWSTGDVQ